MIKHAFIIDFKLFLRVVGMFLIISYGMILMILKICLSYYFNELVVNILL